MFLGPWLLAATQDTPPQHTPEVVLGQESGGYGRRRHTDLPTSIREHRVLWGDDLRSKKEPRKSN
jgi:hypothetical protein